MSRKLHQQLGCYIPSFFEMHIDTYRADMTPNRLPINDATVLFHEYIHFLQDIATYNGLRSIYIYSEYFRSVVNRVKKTCSYAIPFTIPDNDDNVLLNIETQKVTEGDSNEKAQLSIKDIESINDDLMPNDILKSIESIVITDTDGDMFSFGSIAIMESMAYIMERLCSPNGVVQSPDFPYRSAELIAEHYEKGFSNNLEMVLALCDMSLQSANPGRVFVSTMKGIKEGSLSFNRPEDIYDYFYELPASIAGQGEYSMLDAFKFLLSQTQESLNSYLKIPSADEVYHQWIARIVDFSLSWREKNRYFLLDMARCQDLFKNGAWGYAVKMIGSPLMSNNNGDFYKIPPDGLPLGLDVEFFKAFGEIESLFSIGKVQCEMRTFCESPLSDVSMDTNCDSSPWFRCTQNRLCPYALIWRHWGLTDHYPSV